VASDAISSAVTIRARPSLLMANYSMIKKDRPSQEQHHNHNRRKLELREVRRHRRDSRETREDRERGREEV